MRIDLDAKTSNNLKLDKISPTLFTYSVEVLLGTFEDDSPDDSVHGNTSQ